MKIIKKEITSTIIFLLINLGVILIVIEINPLVQYISAIKNIRWLFGIYFSICVLLHLINLKINNRIFAFITHVVLSPFYLFIVIFIAVLTVFLTQLYFLTYLALSFSIPFIIYKINETLILTELKDETWAYLIITSSVIIANLFHKPITFLTFRLIPHTSSKSERKKRHELVELCKYIVSKNNIKMMIYLLFLITLIIFNIMELQQNSYYENLNFDKAILHSFVTFIAFERVLINLKRTEFKPSKLVGFLKLTILNELGIKTK